MFDKQIGGSYDLSSSADWPTDDFMETTMPAGTVLPEDNAALFG